MRLKVWVHYWHKYALSGVPSGPRVLWYRSVHSESDWVWMGEGQWWSAALVIVPFWIPNAWQDSSESKGAAVWLLWYAPHQMSYVYRHITWATYTHTQIHAQTHTKYPHTYMHDACMHTNTHTHTHTYMHACMHTKYSNPIHTYMYVCLHAFTCMYVCMYVCEHLCVCMYARVYVGHATWL